MQMQMRQAGVQDKPILLFYRSKDKSSQEVNEFSVPNQAGDTLWAHITPSNKNELTKYIEQLNMHPLAADAITSFSESPRMDMYQNHMYISTFAIKGDYSTVRISILLGENYVITHEEKNDLEIFSTLLEDFSDHPQHMSNPGHILYHIMDQVSKFYLEAVDTISNEIQAIEKNVFKAPFANEIGHEVYNWKRKIHKLRQVVEAEETVIKDIGNSDLPNKNEDSGIYLKTLENNFQRVVTAFDAFIDKLNGVFDLQMSLKADHTNAIMKTLTLVSVIFIPMTFIAGMYGMNFEQMPELAWRFGYVYVLILMFGLGIGIALYFRSKGWWGNKPKSSEKDN
ncbi:magnesium/cobalt transporter CorA [Bacillus dakarensis]|uniref:magnesium/cobalt transporter CorA n=1 Tax=Robertmurraya dakarensis TaxID=1926278 RepID=UPI000981D3F5|nr:magnesium/cobalt transporter CorA [Bacillus dakarensis]